MDESRTSPLTLAGLGEKAADSPIPLLACRLADQQIVLANNAAADLFCLPSRELVGRRTSTLYEPASAARVEAAISALESGSADSLRARRKILAGDRPVDVLIWARTVQLREFAAAACVLVPASEDTVAGRLVDSYIGSDPIDLALGGVDDHGHVGEATPPHRQILIGLGREEIEGTDVASLVHPDDVDRLMERLVHAALASEETSVNVRLRHPERGWVEVRCLATPTPPGQPLRLAFALPESTDLGGGSDAERFADLERQILRVAAELHALNVTHARDPVAPHHSRIRVLDSLAPRQREIVDRLLGGERVSTIAQSMFLSPSTVRNHLSKVFSVVGVGSQAELLSLLRSALPDDQGR